MTTGMAPMMPPGGHQPQFMGMGLDSSCMPPATQVPSQMQSVPPFMNNLLQTQMPGVSPAATSVTDVANQVQKSSVAGPWNPFFHPNDATAATPEVIVRISFLGYLCQLLACLIQISEWQCSAGTKFVWPCVSNGTSE
jgi:hypothetical protein